MPRLWRGASSRSPAGRATARLSALRRRASQTVPAVAAGARSFRWLCGPRSRARRGGRLRAFDEDDVAFLQLEDLHDLGVDAHDPAARIGGLRLGDPEELLTSGGHVQRVSSRGATARAALAGLRNESALLELMSKPRNEKEKGRVKGRVTRLAP